MPQRLNEKRVYTKRNVVKMFDRRMHNITYMMLVVSSKEKYENSARTINIHECLY